MKSIFFLFLFILLPFISSAQTFSINERGCVTCKDAKPGDTGVIDGVTYTAVDREMLVAKVKAREDLTKVCVSLVTDMSMMFSNHDSFNQSIGNWDVSNVTNMEYMFYGASSFNQPIGNWDVSNVTNMRGMFNGVYSFNQSIGNWNVSSVTDMRGLFSLARSFNQPIGNWDVSNVTNMNGMFGNARSFNQPIGNWNVSKVTDTIQMFFGSDSFNQPIGNWDVSNVTNMGGMFYGASSFNQPIGNWNVSNVTDMSGLFSQARSFNQPIGDWDVSSVTSMFSMFWYAVNFNQPIGDWDLHLVRSMSKMFSNTDKFNQSLEYWDVARVDDMSYMFNMAIKFNMPLGKWDMSSVANLDFMFNQASSYSQDLTSWCVNRFSTEPKGFASNSLLSNDNKPVWATCPENPISFDYIIISPINESEAIPQTFKFTWATIETATQYQLFIYENNYYQSVYVDTILTAQEFELVNPLPLYRNYTLKLRAINEELSVRGYWTNPIGFNTQLPTSTESDENGQKIPEAFQLAQNYPNPFNPSTQIKYNLPNSSFVRLEVYSVLGNRIAVLVNENKAAGEYSIQFDAKNLASGVYLYRLITPEFTQTRSMNVVK